MSIQPARFGNPRPMPAMNSEFDAMIEESEAQATPTQAAKPGPAFVMGGPGEQGFCGIDLDCSMIDTFWLKGVHTPAKQSKESVVQAWRNTGKAIVDGTKAVTDLAAQFSSFLSFGSEF